LAGGENGKMAANIVIDATSEVLKLIIKTPLSAA
jgi:hypothetical protein